MMDILFNPASLHHNIGSDAEGDYRISEFVHSTKTFSRDGEAFITLAHTRSYADFVKETCCKGTILAEVIVLPESYSAACQAVGLAIQASEQNAFAVVRPPGHHAKRDRADGFCLFNNIAIAAQKLVNEGKKVFILDIDGHHGDGTQSIFYDSDKVLYCSIHQHHAYPGTGEKHETGRGEGEGYTMNFPLPAGSGDAELLEAVDQAIARAEEFRPDVVGVSAGFDGYEKDRLLNLNYTLNGYKKLGAKLSRSFPNIFAVLEGGYHFDIKQCVDHFITGVENPASR